MTDRALEPPGERKGSLRTRMLWRVLVPLALIWLVGTLVASMVAFLFTREAFDQTLIDDAYAIAANVVERDGEVALSLSAPAISGILFDRSDKLVYALLRSDGSFIAGTPGLHADLPPPAALVDVRDTLLDGHSWRMATVRRDEPRPFYVVVAQTTVGRGKLLRRLLVYSLAPQALLLLMIGAWLRRSIGRELEPLGRLQRALSQRDSNDLAPVQVAAASRDVEQLTQTVNALMERIHRGLRAQREFAGNVAHELRTPLAGIRALVEYGLARKDPEVWHTQLKSVAASQDRASRLVDQLLALALADEAGDSVVLQPMMVDEIIHHSVLGYMARADAVGVDLGALGLDQPVCAVANRELLEGLLGNLIDNALRYGRPAGGQTPRVTVELRTDGNEVVISVTDNGPGMDMQLRDLLLKRWAQGAAGIKLGEGAGLGLAIVSRYAELLQGRLDFSPGPDGVGLCAGVRLKAAEHGTIPR
jgi:two-component system sensor histidine kinase TctE